MSIAERDAWADARTAATATFLEGEVAAVRRRLWIRRAGGTVLVIAVGTALILAVYNVIDPTADVLWDAPLRVAFLGFGLSGVGLVVMCIGSIRAFWRGVDRPFVTPDAFLPRTERTWLRAQIRAGHPVPQERHTVVADAARRLAAERAFLPSSVGLLLLYVGMAVATPFLSLVVLFTGLVVLTIVRIVRTQVWAGRARRWLARYA